MVELIMQSPSASPYLPVGYLPLNPNPKCLFSISIQNYIFLNSRTCIYIVFFFTTCSSHHVTVWALEKKVNIRTQRRPQSDLAQQHADKRIKQPLLNCFNATLMRFIRQKSFWSLTLYTRVEFTYSVIEFCYQLVDSMPQLVTSWIIPIQLLRLCVFLKYVHLPWTRSH